MSNQEPNLENMTVDAILKQWPQTAQVFRSYGLACLGCAVAPFCEITAVSEIYGLPQEKLIAELRQVIKQHNR